MKNLKSCVLIVLLLGLCFFSNQVIAQNDFIIIVNKNVKLDMLNKNVLRRVYFGFTVQWKDSEKIKPAYTQVNIDAFWNSIETNKKNYDLFWTKRLSSVGGVAPAEFQRGQNVITYVAKTRGAIGIIPASLKNSIGLDCKAIRME